MAMIRVYEKRLGETMGSRLDLEIGVRTGDQGGE